MPFIDQLKQLVELHQAAELAMKDLVVRLWPAEPIPSSYFGLVNWIVGACPRLDAIKRSVCIEGARMAFARAKVHWGRLDAEKLMTEGPPEGKEHRKPELYYEGVMKVCGEAVPFTNSSSEFPRGLADLPRSVSDAAEFY